MSYLKKSFTANAKIENFSHKGSGLGNFKKDDGSYADVEIPFAIPGDVIHAEIAGKKQGRWIGQIKEIQQASSERIQPKCIHFGSCGGCRLQQMDYSSQLKYKQALLNDIFKPLSLDCEIQPIVSCIPEWNYRNKMEFTFSNDLNGNKYLGLIKDSSKGRVLNLMECHLVNGWFINTLKDVRKWWEESDLNAYYSKKNTGSLRTLILREGINTGDRMVMLTVSGNPDFALNREQIKSFVTAVCRSIETPSFNSKLSIFVRIQQIQEGVPTNFYEMHLYGPEYINEHLKISVDAANPPISFNFVISPSSFFQPNSRQAEKFYSTALQLANINENTVIYDLYCGTGTLGICASKVAKQIIGIEISSEAALDAQHNIQLNDCQNVTIISGAVRHTLKQIQEEGTIPLPDVVIVDPPRSGLDPVALKQLIHLNAPVILFISCNPDAQAKNVAELMQYGYKVEVIQPFDQFPHTMHIENVIRLRKIDNP